MKSFASIDVVALMASFNMDGEALVWLKEGDDAGVFGNWETLVQMFFIMFGTKTAIVLSYKNRK